VINFEWTTVPAGRGRDTQSHRNFYSVSTRMISRDFFVFSRRDHSSLYPWSILSTSLLFQSNGFKCFSSLAQWQSFGVVLFGFLRFSIVNCDVNRVRSPWQPKNYIRIVGCEIFLLHLRLNTTLSWGGVRLSPLGTSAVNWLLYQSRMIHDECGAVGGMRIGRGWSITNPTWFDLGSNPGCRGGETSD
jgi:hypothetical protein